jgi:hypothetical protein
LPLAEEVLNVGYTVVALEVFCNTAAALVALVAAPVNAPTKVVDVTLVNPAIVVVVLPSASVVLHNIT